MDLDDRKVGLSNIQSGSRKSHWTQSRKLEPLSDLVLEPILGNREISSVAIAGHDVGPLDLDSDRASTILNSAGDKSGQGNAIALWADLAGELRDWLIDKLAVRQNDALRSGKPVPSALALKTPLFDVPASLVRMLNRDLQAAGIPKRDERDWPATQTRRKTSKRAVSAAAADKAFQVERSALRI